MLINSDFYRMQTKFGARYIFTCVCLPTGGGGLPDRDPLGAETHPDRDTHPWKESPTSWTETPLDRTPPAQRPLDRDPPGQ